VSGPPDAGRSDAPELEPYAVALTIEAGPAGLEPGALCGALLTMVAQGCEREGAAIIGHLKCHVRFAGGVVRGNLTALRTGADCEGDMTGRVAPGESLSLDLAVLVYGLPETTIDALVRAALAAVAPEAIVRRPTGGVAADSSRDHAHGGAHETDRRSPDST
jgi:hypothetical protein